MENEAVPSIDECHHFYKVITSEAIEHTESSIRGLAAKVLGALAVVTASLALSPSLASATSSQRSKNVHLSPAHIISSGKIKDGNSAATDYDSENWSGYQVDVSGNLNTFSGVDTAFTVPTISCDSSEQSDVMFWTGIS